MIKGNCIIKHAAQVVTPTGFSALKGKEMSNLTIIEDGAVVIEQGIITFVGKTSELPSLKEEEYRIIDATGKCVLPGFVDSHTHFVFGGYREEEFSWRMRGDSYMSIMERGGGIVNTMAATRKASEEELYQAGKHRLDTMLMQGVTTVEGKSGYGMNKENELKQLRVMKRLDEDHPVSISKTFMGAHATPAEFKGKEDDFLRYLENEIMPIVAKEHLAENVDIFCEDKVYSVEQSRKHLLKAREYGFNLKIHADEIVQFGGAELAAELKAFSADHLLQASDQGIKDMAAAGVVATLLPITAFSLKEEYARGRTMIDSDCAVALASDLNPGSCFSNSIPLLFALACIYMNFSPEEALTALTLNGAAAIGRADRVGSLEKGKEGDVVILQYPSFKFLPYHIGMNLVEKTIKSGIVYDVLPDLSKK